MLLPFQSGVIRAWRVDDAVALVRHANNRRVWANLRDRFPSPYTMEDADGWLRHCARTVPATDFAIEVEGESVGGIGVVLRSDVERVDAEIGYWLGEACWGRGVMTAAVQTFVPWVLERFNLARLHAHVFEFNGASARVLEKSGFTLEGRLRQSAFKDGRLIDQLLYARIREGWHP
jgi:[ribosomal protein S5]-alanine N-acetyltransferase